VRSRTGLVALVIFVLVVGVACTSDTASRSSSPASPTTAAHHHVTDTTGAAAAANASPKELGAQFEQLLGQHALLAMRLARSEVTNASDVGRWPRRRWRPTPTR
jgi:hypothetical protein